MALTEETKGIKKVGVRQALKRQNRKLQNLMAAIPESGVVPVSHASHMREISATLTRMRDLNIALAYLSGIPNKFQANVYKVTEARISQIIKTLLRV